MPNIETNTKQTQALLSQISQNIPEARDCRIATDFDPIDSNISLTIVCIEAEINGVSVFCGGLSTSSNISECLSFLDLNFYGLKKDINNLFSNFNKNIDISKELCSFLHSQYSYKTIFKSGNCDHVWHQSTGVEAWNIGQLGLSPFDAITELNKVY